MSIGITPKHHEEISLHPLSPEHFLVLAVEATNKMGWRVDYVSSSGLIAFTNKGMFSRNFEIKVKIGNGNASIKSESTGNEMVDWGKNKKNIEEFLSVLEELKSQLTPDQVEEKFQELKVTFPPEEQDLLKLPDATTSEQFKDFLALFKPRNGYFVTPILVDLNILVFFVMVLTGVNIFSPDNESLLAWGADYRPMTIEGEWWRMLTCCFLHIGILHLLLNMYALVYIGLLLEPILGRGRFIAAYLLTGITSSLASLWWHEMTISAGASGAIFGMYGVFLALLTTDLIEKSARKELLMSISVFVGYNLLYGLSGGIDNAGHIGGLLGGIVIGYGFIPSLKSVDSRNLKIGTIAGLSAVVFISSYVVLSQLPNTFGMYQEKMKEFSAWESKALEYYSLPENTSTDKVLFSLQDHGIVYWKKNIQLLDTLKEISLPKVLEDRNELLKEYCELRLQSYELIYKALSENTNLYEAQIEKCNKKIEYTLKELEGESGEKE